MSFNPDPVKPGQELIVSRKLKTVSHPSLTFNNNQRLSPKLINQQSNYVNSNWSFQDHCSLLFIRHLSIIISITPMLSITRIISLCFTKNLRRFNAILLWQQQVLCEELFRKKLYQELGLESLQSRRWFKNFASSKNFKQTSYLDIFTVLFQLNQEEFKYQVLW